MTSPAGNRPIEAQRNHQKLGELFYLEIFKYHDQHTRQETDQCITMANDVMIDNVRFLAFLAFSRSGQLKSCPDILKLSIRSRSCPDSSKAVWTV